MLSHPTFTSPPSFHDVFRQVIRGGAPILFSDSTGIMHNFALLTLLNIVAVNDQDELAINEMLVSNITFFWYVHSLLYTGYVDGPPLVTDLIHATDAQRLELRQKIADLYKNSLLIAGVICLFTIPGFCMSAELWQWDGKPAHLVSSLRQRLYPYAPVLMLRSLQIIGEPPILGLEDERALWKQSVNLWLSIFLTAGMSSSVAHWSPAIARTIILVGFLLEPCIANCIYHPILWRSKLLNLLQHMHRSTCPSDPKFSIIAISSRGLSLIFSFMADAAFLFSMGLMVAPHDQATLGRVLPYIMAVPLISINLAYANRGFMRRAAHEPGAQQNVPQIAQYGVLSVASIVMVCIPVLWLCLEQTKRYFSSGETNTNPLSADFFIASSIAYSGMWLDAVRTTMSLHLRWQGNQMWRGAILEMISVCLGSLASFELGIRQQLGLRGVLSGYVVFCAIATTLLIPTWWHEIHAVPILAASTSSPPHNPPLLIESPRHPVADDELLVEHDQTIHVVTVTPSDAPRSPLSTAGSRYAFMPLPGDQGSYTSSRQLNLK